jgi:DNA-binding transcriptional MerR regulator
MAPIGDEQAKSVEQKIAELQQQLSEAQNKLREKNERTETSDQNREIEEVRTASMKLPAFWRRDPKLWFSQIEAQFHSHLVRSDTSKYYAVIAALDCSTLQPVSNIIANPPATGKYDAVKKTLIDSYSDSREQQIRKLLKELDLGDRKPSELLREMKTLASDHVDDQMLQTLWLHRLPLNVQLLVSASDGVPLEKMASIADKLVEIVSFYATTSTVTVKKPKRQQ